jgi:hypothetical protein
MKLLCTLLAIMVLVYGISPVPIVSRITNKIDLVEERIIKEGSSQLNLKFYRNEAYECGLTGKYTFMVARRNTTNTSKEEIAPLWAYLHGGGSGYWDEQGTYFALGDQTEDTWNHEETFDGLIDTLNERMSKNGEVQDNTLSRRLAQGYRMVVVAMCDHDQYLGMEPPYPNNPNGPNAQVNGLQATMAAINYTAANFPTSHAFVHGTSAGSVGAYAIGMSYSAESINLTAVVSDSILGVRGTIIIDSLAGTPGFPQQEGYDSAGVDTKVGQWRDDANQLDPESRIADGFDTTPILQIGGLVDPLCAGNRSPLPEAASDGFSNNCVWMAQPLNDLIAALPDSPHKVAQLPGEGHVPTINAGAAHDIVDRFLEAASAVVRNPSFPNSEANGPTPIATQSGAPAVHAPFAFAVFGTMVLLLLA